MSLKKIRFTSYIEDKTYEEIKKLSKDTRVPVAAYVEEAFLDLLKKYGRESDK